MNKEQDNLYPGHESSVRLTRRGKLAAGALAAVVGLGLLHTVKNYEANESPFSEETVTHIVDEGDTLWEIAGDVNNSHKIDKREIMSHIRDMPENAETFSDNTISPGEIVERPESVNR